MYFVEHSKNEFIGNMFLRQKKDGRYPPVITLKHLNQFLPYHNFKMEGLKQVKELLAEGDFMVKLDLQDIFQHPFSRGNHEIRKVSVGRKTVQVLLPVFRLGSSTTSFYKVTKKSNIFDEKNINPACDIFRQSVGNGEK